MADRPRAARDQHGAAVERAGTERLGRAVGPQREVGGERGDAERRAEVERGAVGQRHDRRAGSTVYS